MTYTVVGFYDDTDQTPCVADVEAHNPETAARDYLKSDQGLNVVAVFEGPCIDVLGADKVMRLEDDDEEKV